jgi:pyruvate dehydrogenase E2 component (dihydrolipoamide acetyltransferase)
VTRVEEIRVPDIGDFEDVPVIEVVVAPGDSVVPEDPLITLESDKATMDVPAPAAGTIKEMKVSVGDTVSRGSVILTLEVTDEGATASPTSPGNGAGNGPMASPEESVEAPAATAPAAAALRQVLVPDIGDFEDVPVIEIAVAPGDPVSPEDPLITLESDKATMDVPAPEAGVIKEIKVAVGDTVSAGTLIALMETSADAEPAPEQPAAPAARVVEQTPTPAPAPPAPSAAPGRPSPTAGMSIAEPQARGSSHATPSIRRYARELGVELDRVRGTGRKGRILKDDVTRFVKGELSRPSGAGVEGGAGIPPIPAVDFAKFGPVEIQALGRIKRIAGPHLHRAWLNVPHVTHHDEADVTEMEAFRRSLKDEAERQGVRVTALSFIMKALTTALRQFPNFNASLSADGESLVLKKYFNIGIAVDTPNGLVVPVIREVDGKGIFELGAELAEVSARAREGKLTPAEMQGGCMSVSSLGGIGGTAFTPIVTAPEVAILGVTRARMTPVWNGKEFAPRLMLPLDLSYDHRVIDGAEAARFVSFLAQVLGDVRRLLL